MRKNSNRQLSIALSTCLILLGWSQWRDPTESSMRWKWLQDLANHLFGLHGHAKFLIISGCIWLLWILVLTVKDFYILETHERNIP